MKFTPRQNFVVLKMDAPAEQTKKGILLVQSAQDDRMPATVLAVGPGVRTGDKGEVMEVVDLQVDDRVVFNKYSALELDDTERLYLIRDTDIGCKIDDE